jgi:hypothetical protein
MGEEGPVLTACFQREIDNPDDLYAAFEAARLNLLERLARNAPGLEVRRYTDAAGDTEYLDVDFPQEEGKDQPQQSLAAFAHALARAGLALPRFAVDSEGERWLLEHLFGERVRFAEVRGGRGPCPGFASPRPIRRELRSLSSETGEPVADAALVERILRESGVRLDSQGRDRKLLPSADGATFFVDLTEDEALDAVEEETYVEGRGYFDLEISP